MIFKDLGFCSANLNIVNDFLDIYVNCMQIEKVLIENTCISGILGSS